MAGHLDKVEHFRDVVGPVGENFLWWFRFSESSDAGGAIDFAIEPHVGDHVGNVPFDFILGETENGRQPWYSDLRVVFRDDPDVVLDDARVEKFLPSVVYVGISRERDVRLDGGLVGEGIRDDFVANEELEAALCLWAFVESG